MDTVSRESHSDARDTVLRIDACGGQNRPVEQCCGTAVLLRHYILCSRKHTLCTPYV